ncbi:LysR family transcriptional regulator [Thermocatellispora tengchongensis]|uniref:LysR family transcriptional regulator n=1 Tax=Thermocatellispora tengchongensis TaxID=1073253 RepID=UPI00363003BD
MDLELRHLKIVRAVAEAGSVSKAATMLGLAQPALTAQLKRIERVLGGALFDRDHTGAHPTALGELVLTRARVLLPAARQLQEEAARFANSPGTEQRFRLGATNSPILGGLVDRLAAADPPAAVSTYTSWSAEELAGMVLRGRLDYALVGVCGESRPPAADSLIWRTVAVDAVCVLVSDDHPWPASPRPAWNDSATRTGRSPPATAASPTASPPPAPEPASPPAPSTKPT